jgi:hypothetical protein
MMQRIGISIIICLCLSACQNHTETNDNGTISTTEAIAEDRKVVNRNAIAEYDELLTTTQTQKLNAFHFKATLFETKKTFVYNLKFEFETQQEESEIAYPNLGYAPEPVLRKSTTEKQTIEIGFKNPKGEFMPFKNLVADEKGLHLRTIAKYTLKQREVEK